MLRALPFVLATASMAVPAQDDATRRARPPNVLLILADDLGYGDVGCYNPEAKAPTPNLDRLAAEGLRFTDAHSPSTVCTPTRYSLLTGRMAFRTGFHSVFVGVGGPNLIEPERPTLATLLGEAGYATAMVGKWHVGLTFLDRAGERVVPSPNGSMRGRGPHSATPASFGCACAGDALVY